MRQVRYWVSFASSVAALNLAAMAVPAFGQALLQAENPAIVPTDRLSEDWWKQRHEAVLHNVPEHPDTQLLLIGDSITNNYDKSTLPDENFQPTWKTFYEPRKALNLGFSGDTTANVLWRLDHGEVAGLHPKVAMVLIGTNNTGFKSESAEETEVGIDAVIANLEQSRRRRFCWSVFCLVIFRTRRPRRTRQSIAISQTAIARIRG
jgi:lysophospholipase L1-like esterase